MKKKKDSKKASSDYDYRKPLSWAGLRNKGKRVRLLGPSRRAGGPPGTVQEAAAGASTGLGWETLGTRPKSRCSNEELAGWPSRELSPQEAATASLSCSRPILCLRRVWRRVRHQSLSPSLTPQSMESGVRAQRPVSQPTTQAALSMVMTREIIFFILDTHLLITVSMVTKPLWRR